MFLLQEAVAVFRRVVFTTEQLPARAGSTGDDVAPRVHAEVKSGFAVLALKKKKGRRLMLTVLNKTKHTTLL